MTESMRFKIKRGENVYMSINPMVLKVIMVLLLLLTVLVSMVMAVLVYGFMYLDALDVLSRMLFCVCGGA